MKKTFLLFVMLSLFFTTTQAQDIDKFFNNYSDNKQFEYVSVSPFMMKFASLFAYPDSKMEDFVSKTKGIKVLTLRRDNGNTLLYNKFQKDIDILIHSNFEKVIISQNNGEDTNIYKRFTEKNNADIVILTSDSQKTNIIWFNGKFSEEELNDTSLYDIGEDDF